MKEPRTDDELSYALANIGVDVVELGERRYVAHSGTSSTSLDAEDFRSVEPLQTMSDLKFFCLFLSGYLIGLALSLGLIELVLFLTR